MIYDGLGSYIMQPLFKLQASQVRRRFYLPLLKECRRRLRCPHVEATKLLFAGAGTLDSDPNLTSNLT